MADPIQLIVGLGNPGAEYADTRHNVGAWFVETLAEQAGQSWRHESKFHGLICKVTLADQACWCLLPTTYMNESGRAVSAMMRFYKLSPHQVLVAHDELDFPAGKIKFKQNGGHGGHNGLRDLMQHLNNDFYRLRLGIGHPGNRDHVTPYVLGMPPKSDKEKIDAAISEGLAVLPDIVSGEMDRAMRKLH